MQARSWWFCTAIVVSLLVSEARAQQTVHWYPDLETGVGRARETNRLVLVHFWAPSCRYCREMDRDVFSLPDVVAAMEANFVPVKINANDCPRVARQMGITGLPTEVILSSRGQPITRIEGKVERLQYLARLNEIAATFRRQPVQSYAKLPARPTLGNWDRAEARPVAAKSARPGLPSDQLLDSRRVPDSRYVEHGRQRGQPQASSADYRRRREQDNRPSGRSLSSPGGLAQRADPVSARRYPASWQQPQVPQYQDQAGLQAGSGSPDPASRSLRRESWSADPASAPTHRGAPRQSSQALAAAGGPSGVRWSASSQSPADTRRATTAGRSSGSAPLGLEGFCPVRLRTEQRWMPGDPRWSCVYEGRTYLFAGREELLRFQSSPEVYSPVLSGNDVILHLENGQDVPGRREFGGTWDGRVFLFTSEASFRKFRENPDRYANAILRPGRSSFSKRTYR